ncbi:MAG: transketolase C-terminal domain-containing protein, partial [Eubacteriales bacterium]
DYSQATRGPGHGDFRMLVLAPANVQEMADLTIKAFDLADKYRMTAMMFADGTMGQMMEPVELKPSTSAPAPKPWAANGTENKRKHNIINSLILDTAYLEQLNFDRYKKYAEIEKTEAMWEEFMMEDAEICVVSYGITSRISKNAIVDARKKGIKVGMIRPITLWPFPKKPLLKAADSVKCFISVELSMGQMMEDVELATRCKKPVYLCNRVGGMLPSPEEVCAAIEKANEGGAKA